MRLVIFFFSILISSKLFAVVVAFTMLHVMSALLRSYSISPAFTPSWKSTVASLSARADCFTSTRSQSSTSSRSARNADAL